MFEKEAEEYIKTDGTKAEQILNILNERFPLKTTLKQLPFILAMLKQIFQDGAEFGYNLAKEEIDYLNKHWRSEEERKANEWHFVKDELPDHNGQFYVALKGQTETFILNYDYDEYDESKMVWLDYDDTNFDDEVYAWREKLKAPKEIE